MKPARSSRIELQYINGFNGKYKNVLKIYKPKPDSIIYPIGGFLVTEETRSKAQSFLKVHDMDISAMAVSGILKFSGN
jgi:hypothetical protein